MSIHVADDKKIIVKVPLGTPTFVAENFIKEKKDWIMKQMAKVEKQTALADSMGPLTEEDIKQIKKKAKKVIPESRALRKTCSHFLQPDFYTPTEVPLGQLLGRRKPQLQLPSGSHAAGSSGQRSGSRTLPPPPHESFPRVLR